MEMGRTEKGAQGREQEGDRPVGRERGMGIRVDKAG